jgi:hypothetical protein
MFNIITFNKPTTNIQRGFGLFSLLDSLSFVRKGLTPTELFIVIDLNKKTYYSSAVNPTPAINIPANYRKLLITFEK